MSTTPDAVYIASIRATKLTSRQRDALEAIVGTSLRERKLADNPRGLVEIISGTTWLRLSRPRKGGGSRIEYDVGIVKQTINALRDRGFIKLARRFGVDEDRVRRQWDPNRTRGGIIIEQWEPTRKGELWYGLLLDEIENG